MREKYETKHIFMAIGICFIVVSPIMIIFIPLMLAEFFHYTPKVWHVFVPMENYLVCAIGLMFFIVAFMLLFLLEIHKKSIILCLVCLGLGIASIYIASQSYQRLADDHLSYQEIFTTQRHDYPWEEVKEVTQIIERGGNSKYTFVFHDGNDLTIDENGHFIEIKGKLLNKLQDTGIEFVQIRLE